MKRRIAVTLSLAALAAATGVGFAAAGAAGADEGAARTIDRDLDLAGARTLDVRAGAADVRVRSGPARRGGPGAHVRVTLRGESVELGSTALRVAREGDRVVVTVGDPKQSAWWFIRIWASASVTCEVDLFADVELAVRTGSGDVVIDAPPRAVAARTGSGDLAVTAPRGTVDAHTGSGDLAVRAAASSLALHTGSGSIDAALSPGWSGNLVEARTGSGGVRLTVPAGFRGSLQTRTGTGSVTDDAHVIAASSPVVRVKTGSGDIKIVAAH